MQWVSLVAIGEIYLVYKSSVNDMAMKHLNPNPTMLMTDSYSMDLKYTLIFSGDIFNRISKLPYQVTSVECQTAILPRAI